MRESERENEVKEKGRREKREERERAQMEEVGCGLQGKITIAM